MNEYTYYRYDFYFCTVFFFFNDTATTEIYTLSLHDALPISRSRQQMPLGPRAICTAKPTSGWHTCSFRPNRDRKSTRLNSSHVRISYAVFCLKKKKKNSRSGHRLYSTDVYV